MTPLSRREHPAARNEYLDALAWYDDQETGLGERLALEFDDAVTFIQAWPGAAPFYRGRNQQPALRRKGVNAFPYGIIYFIRDEEVVIVAYAHAKRRPGYWRGRLATL